jgi:hypothetical protein
MHVRRWLLKGADMIRTFWLLPLVLLSVVVFSDQVSAQKRTGGSTQKSQSVPNSRSGHADSVGYFQMRVGGAANTAKKPVTSTTCAPVGGKRPARC